MKMQRVVVLFCILCCIHMMSAVNVDGDDDDGSLEAWSCSSDATHTSEDYRQKVSDVLDVLEDDILNHASWDLMSRMTGVGNAGVVGSAGCLPSREMNNMEECYACILKARVHLRRRCPKNLRGYVFLKSCTLMYARVERASEDSDWEGQVHDDRVIFRAAS